MKFVFTDRHEQHDPQFFLVRGRVGRSAEQPERAHILKAGAIKAGLEPVEAQNHGREIIEKIHDPVYLRFLEDASEEWQALAGASAEVTPNVHPNRLPSTYPRSLPGRAGWHQADTACPIGPHTYRAVIASAQVALTGADLVRSGETCVYALCRPPGHHACADMAGGFCFLNNSAIAAQSLLQDYERVAILDIDVHHGNGTQGIFYERGDVLTVSIHADPMDYYPFYWGHAHERGEGPGEGFNLNLPLSLGSGDEDWLAHIDKGLDAIKRFNPGALVVALGLDAHERDPLQGLSVTTPGFTRAARLVASLSLPTLLVQEGGYLSSDLGENLRAYLIGVD